MKRLFIFLAILGVSGCSKVEISVNLDAAELVDQSKPTPRPQQYNPYFAPFTPPPASYPKPKTSFKPGLEMRPAIWI